VQGDPGLLGKHLDRAQAADRLQDLVEGGPDGRRGVREMLVQAAERGAGVGLVAIGEPAPAFGARPHLPHPDHVKDERDRYGF